MTTKSNGVYKNVEVSKTNYNRHRFHTHTMRRVLSLEGYQTVTKDGVTYVLIGESWITLDKVAFVQRPKAPKIEPAAPVVEAPQAEEAVA